MSEATESTKPASPQADSGKAKTDAKPAPKAAKAKEPDKPFVDIIEQDLIPALKDSLQKRGITDLEVSFQTKTLSGTFGQGKRLFSVLFVDETLAGTKFFTCGTDGIPASTVESFMIDERRVDVGLAVFYIVQRLFAQGWL
ncbi:MAG: DUF2996 domain-containing protein [Synechococcaceae cyanobacterium SM2_3_2]|nr:DUF2996 domain-containing protein [Synechococcaceae cyanobacterium SM2_3_2]